MNAKVVLIMINEDGYKIVEIPLLQDTNILVSIQNGNLSIFHQNQNKPEGSSSRTSTANRLSAAADLADGPM